VSPYSRPQLWVLLAIVALGGLGVAVGGWRRAHPDLAERVERFDAEMVSSTDARMPASVADPRARPGAGHASASRDWRASTRGDHGGAARGPGRTQAPVAVREAKRHAGEGPLDLNRATAEDLRRLPGVGPALAERILAAREQSGRFESVEDLRAVPGIGEVKLARLRDLVTVSR
jgi:competence ComEA-like helix-hairpin-helix protein